MKDVTIVLSLTLNHNCFTHRHSCLIVAPFSVNSRWFSCVPFLYHIDFKWFIYRYIKELQLWSKSSLNNRKLFISVSISLWQIFFFKWLLNWCNIRREFSFNKAPFLLSLILLIHNFIPASSIQPLSYMLTTTTTLGSISEGLSIVLRLKMIIGLSLVPSAQHERTTV